MELARRWKVRSRSGQNSFRSRLDWLEFLWEWVGVGFYFIFLNMQKSTANLDFCSFRISAIQRNTADLQAEIKRLQECKTEQEDSQQRETLEVTVPTGQLPGTSTLPHARQLKCLDRDRDVVQCSTPPDVSPSAGLSLSESLNPESLNKHLEQLAQKRNELLNKKKNQYVPVQVKTDLDVKMKVVLNQRDELSVENDKLLLR